jgi:two-component system chemotaxis response regulator CheB
MRHVEVDHTIPLAGMAELLARLCQEPDNQPIVMEKDNEERNALEVSIAEGDNAFEKGVMEFGALTPYTCPDCHGTLSAWKEGGRVRFRCHTGHAFSADSLLATLTENIEDSIWSAIRGVEESIMLLNHMGDHFAETNDTRTAAAYFRKASEAKSRTDLLRNAVLAHEQLTAEKIEGEEG